MVRMINLSYKLISIALFSGSVIFVNDNNYGKFNFKDNVICYNCEENIDGTKFKGTEIFNIFEDKYFDRYKNCINYNFSYLMDIGFNLSNNLFPSTGINLNIQYQLYNNDYLPCEQVLQFHKGDYLPWYNIVLEEDYYNTESPFYSPAEFSFSNNNIHIYFGSLPFEEPAFLVLSIKISWFEDYKVHSPGDNLAKSSECIVVYKL